MRLYSVKQNIERDANLHPPPGIGLKTDGWTHERTHRQFLQIQGIVRATKTKQNPLYNAG